ncbi:MAG: hypothetical protein KGL39_06435 [Patescibacteria group bacterium]|nr:hypothetical protein [Patescibacteria group bacterium]
MTWTNFPGGVTSLGAPIVGGFGGIPLTGNWWFCDYLNGSDGNATSGSGGAGPDAPLQSIATAYSLAADGKNDVIVIMGDGLVNATQRLSAKLTWAKNALHLIGMGAPSLFAQRARISTLTTQTTNINPLIDVTGSGCVFANFSFFQGVGQASTDEQLITISGTRNYFGNVAFGGMGHANGAARAGSYVIGFTGGGENLFERCSVGLETVARSAANASVKIVAASQRNDFIDCVFDMYPTANSPLFLDASLSGGLNGSTMMFKRCTFRGLVGASGYTQPSVTATVAADINGVVYFDNCSTIAAKYAANGGEVATAAATNANGLFTAAS